MSGDESRDVGYYIGTAICYVLLVGLLVAVVLLTWKGLTVLAGWAL